MKTTNILLAIIALFLVILCAILANQHDFIPVEASQGYNYTFDKKTGILHLYNKSTGDRAVTYIADVFRPFAANPVSSSGTNPFDVAVQQ